MFCQRGLTVCPPHSGSRSRTSVTRARLALLCLLSAGFGPTLVAQPLESVQFAAALQEQQQILRQTVESLESSGDIWHPMIAESMTNLGSLLQQAGRHEEALTALERAAHVNRVNHGLFSLQQSPALAMQIDSQMALNQWEDADRLMREHFYIHVRAMPEGGTALIPALKDYADWHLQAFVNYRVPLRLTRLVDAYQLHRVIVKALQDDPEHDPALLEQYLRQMAFITWRLSRVITVVPADVLFDSTRQVSDEWVDYLAPDTLRIRNNTIVMGEHVLQALVESTEKRLLASEGTAAERDMLRDYIRARLDMADWYLYANFRRQAASEYQRIRQELAERDSSLVDELFGKVVILPAFDYELQADTERAFPGVGLSGLRTATTTSVQDHTDWLWVDIEFELTRYGRVSSADILGASTELSDNVRRQILAELRAGLLRPVITEQGAVNSDKLVYRFLYHPDRFGNPANEDSTATDTTEDAAIESGTIEAQ